MVTTVQNIGAEQRIPILVIIKMNHSTVDLSHNKYQKIGQTVDAYGILNYKRK